MKATFDGYSRNELNESDARSADYFRTYGWLAHHWCHKCLHLSVLSSAAGWYIGTADDEGPVSRESAIYWKTREQAEAALAAKTWPQKSEP